MRPVKHPAGNPSHLRIHFSRYELIPKRKMGGHAWKASREGALIQIEHPRFGVGYADIHPWPELSGACDLPLDEQLRELSQGILTRLTRSALEWARIDARARSLGRSLFEGYPIPESHFLLTDLTGDGVEQAERAFENGFTRLKLKLGADWRDRAFQLQALRAWLAQWPESLGAARLRIDFNSSLSPEDFGAFLETTGLAPWIDFVEDPIVWDPQSGFSLLARAPAFPEVRLALDLGVNGRSQGTQNPLSDGLLLTRDPDRWDPAVVVIKPAIQGVSNIWMGESPRKNVITSYLGHPLGQLAAASFAARAQADHPGKVGICGLLSHEAYEPTKFSRALRVRGPRLESDGTPGLGMGDLLEGLDWLPLGTIAVFDRAPGGKP